MTNPFHIIIWPRARRMRQGGEATQRHWMKTTSGEPVTIKQRSRARGKHVPHHSVKGQDNVGQGGGDNPEAVDADSSERSGKRQKLLSLSRALHALTVAVCCASADSLALLARLCKCQVPNHHRHRPHGQTPRGTAAQ